MPAELIDAIRARQQKQTEFGYGILTADRYVANMQQLAGVDLCYRYASKGNVSFTDVLEKAARTLVYSNQDMVVETKQVAIPDGIQLPKNTLMVFKHVLTTPRVDRDGDILRTQGAEIDPKMLLLWQHVHTLPIGKMLYIAEHNEKQLVLVSCIVDMNELSHDAAVMVDNDMARFSHGFRALEYQQMKAEEGETSSGGFEITKFEIMEESIVSVPSNADAEQQEILLSLVEGGKLTSGLMKECGKTIRAKQPMQVAGGFHEDESGIGTKAAGGTEQGAVGRPSEKADAEAGSEENEAEIPQVKRIQGISKWFDVDKEELLADRLEYEWCSRFIGVPVKALQVVCSGAGSIYMGSFLSALERSTEGWEVHDTRNITKNGEEVPPNHEMVELNSKERKTFLVDGIRFYHTDKDNVAIKMQRTYSGIDMIVYSKNTEGCELIDRCWEWVREHNYLKGEAFSLTGSFLKRDDLDWKDVFLDSKNAKAVQQASNRLNEQGIKTVNRGIIMMGPPGTGKTLSGRILMNQTKATYIWVAARDFYRMGAASGLCHAFDLANELAPSVLFIEDVDNWLSSYEIDIIKTEMDGIAKSSGVLTILTTNYPERLPDALIDRPGRFHDVLSFSLPSADIRKMMLQRWTEAIDEKELLSIVKDTEGYSGAHIYELCYYAKTLAEEEGTEIGIALKNALAKIAEQRELIGQDQLVGEGRMLRRSFELWTKGVVQQEEKGGRMLSARNLATLKECLDDMNELIDKGYEMTRGGVAICERVQRKLSAVVDAAGGNEEQEEKQIEPVLEEKQITIKEATSVILACASTLQRTKLIQILTTMNEAESRSKRIAQYRALRK